MTSLCAASVLCLATLGLPAASLDGYLRREVPRGVVLSRGWSAGEVDWASEYLERSLSRVERRLGRRLMRPIAMVLAGSRQEMARLARELGGSEPGPLVQGLAFPSRAVLIVRRDLLDLSVPGDPAAVTIDHEVAHIVLHSGRPAGIPRWLDEGVAVWASQGRIAAKEEAYLSLLARTGSLYRLKTLQRAFPRGSLATSVAYQQSFLIVRFLVERWGDESIPSLIDRLEAGEDALAALSAVTGLSAERFEEEFTRYAAGLHSLVGSLVALLNVWTVAGLLAVVAIGRYLLRRRRLLRRLAEEEAAGEPAGPGGAVRETTALDGEAAEEESPS